MSTQRDKNMDRTATYELMKGKGKSATGQKNWLGHGSGAACMDDLLLVGATKTQLETCRRGFHNHLSHLRREHGLMVQKIGATYQFIDPTFEAEDVEESDDYSGTSAQNNPPSPLSSSGVSGCASTESTPKEIPEILQTSAAPSPSDHWGAVIGSAGNRNIYKRETCKNKIISNLSSMPEDVIFIIRGTDPAGINATLDAVHNHLCNPAHSPPPSPQNCYYAYKYKNQNNVIFYVGKGNNTRALAHARDVIGKLRSGNSRNGQKEREIENILQSRSPVTINNIYNNINIYQYCTNHWSELAHFAIENFFITYEHGPFSLSNDTCGNTKFSPHNQTSGISEAFCWLVQPIHVRTAVAGARNTWQNVAKDFVNTGCLSLVNRAKLVWLDVELLLHRQGSQIYQIRNSVLSQHWLGAGPIGQDVTLEWNIPNKPCRFQLICSRKGPKARVNVRPCKNAFNAAPTQRQKITFLQHFRGTQWRNAIRMQNSPDPFIKPFAVGGNGMQDIEFNYVDSTMTHDYTSLFPLSSATNLAGALAYLAPCL